MEALQELRKANKETPIYIITAFYEEFIDELKWIASVFPVVLPRGQASESNKKFFLALDFLWSCHREDQSVKKEGIEFELLKEPIHSDQILFVAKSVLEGPIAIDERKVQ